VGIVVLANVDDVLAGDLRHHSGKGLLLVTELAKANKGRVWIRQFRLAAFHPE
jgi:hypothetical protein